MSGNYRLTLPSRRNLGEWVDLIGTKLGIPETGISEKIAGGETSNTQNWINSAKASEINKAYPSGNSYHAAGEAVDKTVGGGATGSWEPKQDNSNSNGGGGNGGGGNGPSDTEVQQLAKMQSRNPVQESRYQELMSQQSGQDRAAIDDAYKALFNEFGKQEQAVRAGAETNRGDINARYGVDKEKYNAELDKMLSDIGTNKKDFLKSVSDAIAQNVNDYNALSQRSNVRYGGGSSVGDLMKELATKELFKQQGLTRREKSAGEAKFAGLIKDANTFVSQKLGDLDLWKREALGKIDSNMSAQLAQIGAQRASTEAEKANAKLGVLQQARQQAQKIAMMDAEIRNNLASAYVANLQEISGRTMTPEQVKGIYSQFSDINFKPYEDAAAQSIIPSRSTLSKDDEDKINQLFTIQH